MAVFVLIFKLLRFFFLKLSPCRNGNRFGAPQDHYQNKNPFEHKQKAGLYTSKVARQQTTSESALKDRCLNSRYT